MSSRDADSLHERAISALIRQAQNGDREAAHGLIADFAALAKDPNCFDAVGGVPFALTQYIATCLADWQKSKFKDAERYFYVDRKANRPDETTGKHVKAMRAYLLLRGRNAGACAAEAGAATYSGLTEGQVKNLVEKDRPKTTGKPGDPLYPRPIGTVEFAALMEINPRLHKRVLNPQRKIHRISHPS